MSACDPIDLSVIKQEVLLDFFDFHLKNEDVWAILNENSVFLASNLFKLTGIEQFLYNIFYPSFSNLLKSDFWDVTSKDIVVSFPSYSLNRQLKEPPIYFIQISRFNDDLFFLKAISLFINNLSLYDINIICKDKDIEKIPLERFKNVNPSDELLEDEWKIAWLFISGMSYRQIASFLNVSRTTVENKMKSVYGKMELLGEGNFKYVAEVYSWKKYIPRDLLKDFFIHLF
ncbi:MULTISPECIES: helix-turn-helix transcriptional regulator [unclassified Providencia]|uniref:helix-turn-helix transcriptional regulator n=1 Tax=unclassified Providencia TaxID=2633465 RepID=UPI003C2FC771